MVVREVVLEEVVDRRQVFRVVVGIVEGVADTSGSLPGNLLLASPLRLTAREAWGKASFLVAFGIPEAADIREVAFGIREAFVAVAASVVEPLVAEQEFVWARVLAPVF